MTTFVLWIFLQGGQLATIQGFQSEANCREVGEFYRNEASKGTRSLEFKCGPGPDILGGPGARYGAPRAAYPMPPRYPFYGR